MNRRLRTVLLAGALALTGLTCAPQDDQSVKKGNGPDAGGGTLSKGPVVVPPTSVAKRIDAALDNVARRDLLTTHAFWTIFHGILGMGPDITLLDPKTEKRAKALDLICEGAEIRGLEFIPTPDGVDVRTLVGSGVGQGHQDQFIAEMAQWGMPLEREFKVGGKRYTFADFVRHSKMRASTTKNQELSWAVLIVAEYFGPDHKWTNTFGETLTVEDMVRYETHQPIDSAACGGTHRLFGITWALHRHLEKGGKLEGGWKEAADKIAEYKERARKFRNGDGSFASTYLAGPGHSRDLQTRIGTTGHVLEWLALAMTKEELTRPWMEEAASALSTMVLENQNNPIDGGALYHACHGLHIYRTRVYGATPPRGLLVPLPPGY